MRKPIAVLISLVFTFLGMRTALASEITGDGWKITTDIVNDGTSCSCGSKTFNFTQPAGYNAVVCSLQMSNRNVFTGATMDGEAFTSLRTFTSIGGWYTYVFEKSLSAGSHSWIINFSSGAYKDWQATCYAIESPSATPLRSFNSGGGTWSGGSFYNQTDTGTTDNSLLLTIFGADEGSWPFDSYNNQLLAGSYLRGNAVGYTYGIGNTAGQTLGWHSTMGEFNSRDSWRFEFGGSVCGDDMCTGNETCLSCTSDCGACGSGGVIAQAVNQCTIGQPCFITTTYNPSIFTTPATDWASIARCTNTGANLDYGIVGPIAPCNFTSYAESATSTIGALQTSIPGNLDQFIMIAPEPPSARRASYSIQLFKTGSSNIYQPVSLEIDWKPATSTTGLIYNPAGMPGLEITSSSSLASSSASFDFWGNFTGYEEQCASSTIWSGGFVPYVNCYVLHGAMNIPVKLVNWFGNGLKGAGNYIIGNLFPFNVPYQINKSWSDSAGAAMPSGLTEFTPNEDGNLTWTIPAALAGATSSVVIFGSGMTEGNTTANAFLAGVRSFSTYLLYAGFIFGIWAFGKKIYKEIYDVNDDEIVNE